MRSAEFFEEPRDVVRAHADAGIRNQHADEISGASNSNSYAAALGVFERIVNKIDEHLLKFVRINAYAVRFTVGGECERQPTFNGDRQQLVNDLFYECADVLFGKIIRHPPLFNA